ncbi:hypothetical protein DUNSADRAFT_2527 [Dunaliella salina]|uniref:Encoded protein n=1 Tax=Dunaliella salina TaxID=3046 RepID=A0ABQ7GVJ2_DUNSA|nr:hypothetical protein DUNSADRAFT_2527 [Dunaliella salina]|eukprot:KAF5838618.1 hypothetical protein DUNSADRAFT_2527 [Dunaliella salina]
MAYQRLLKPDMLFTEPRGGSLSKGRFLPNSSTWPTRASFFSFPFTKIMSSPIKNIKMDDQRSRRIAGNMQ